MVGWTRRNREDSERRERWWNSLTEEQKQQWIADKPKRDAADRKILFVFVPLFVVLYCGFWSVMIYIKDKSDKKWEAEHGKCLEWHSGGVPVPHHICDKWER